MKQLITRLRQSTFLRHNAIFFAGSVAVGVLNYLYYPILGRLLEPAVFGEVQTLVTLFLQMAIFLSVLSLVAVNIVATYPDKAKAERVLYELEKAALLVSVAVLIIISLGSEYLRQIFQFESAWPFIILALALIANVPVAFRTAYLRGVKKFGETSWANLIGSGSKLLFSVLFVLLGLQTLGAIGGLVAAQLVAFLYAARQARRAGLQKRQPYWRWPQMPAVLPELKYALLVFTGTLGIMLLFSADVLIVKYLFDPHTAGLYAGIATVARIVFFLTGSVAQVLLPSVTIQQSTQQNYAVLAKSMALTIAIALPVLIVTILAPAQLVGILMGQAYLPLSGLLPLLTTAILVLSLANLLVLYHLALRRWAVAGFVIITVAVTFGLMAVNHGSLQAIVTNLLYGSAACFLIIGTWTISDFIKYKRTAH